MERSVCFLVDDSILAHHHGVRRLIFSIAHALTKRWQVDILLSRPGQYFPLEFSDEVAKSNGFDGDKLFGEGRTNIIKLLQEGAQPAAAALSEWRVAGGPFTGKQLQYDCVVVGAPWVWKDDMVLPSSPRNYCIAYDAIPNFYALERPGDPGLCAFAQEHINAYVKFTSTYDGLLAISQATADQCASVLMSDKYAIHVIPQIFPAGFSEISSETEAHGRHFGEIVLAAPFDLRKGLHAMPGLINGSGARSLVIFGGVRCSRDDVVAFFDQLEIDDVIWWSSISFEKQVDIYRHASLLLFPSLNEGLGLPVMEAYACGANVAVSDINPLNQLALAEGILYQHTGVSPSGQISNLLAKMPAPSAVKEYARGRWASEHIFGLFKNIV